MNDDVPAVETIGDRRWPVTAEEMFVHMDQLRPQMRLDRRLVWWLIKRGMTSKNRFYHGVARELCQRICAVAGLVLVD